MPNKSIQLFSYPTSPYAQKVGCYLKYKQLDFKLVPVNPLTNAEIAFTRQRQVPVLQIGDEWRKDSSPIGLWLDEQYPSQFRYAVEWQNPYYSITNGWRLARAVNHATPLPWYARIIWPFGVKRAKFIVEMVKNLDLAESIPEMNQRLQNEFVEHLAGGEYFAGQSQPSLADFSAFPTITSSYMMGMKSKQSLRQHADIAAWALRVYQHLPANPFLVPDHLLKRSLA